MDCYERREYETTQREFEVIKEGNTLANCLLTDFIKPYEVGSATVYSGLCVCRYRTIDRSSSRRTALVRFWPTKKLEMM